MSALYHLAYISKSTLGDNPIFVRNEVQEILECAKRNNPRMHITGALLYSGGYFCQLIEGPRGKLEDLFETILRDDRHEAIEMLFFDPAPERLFGVWAMAFAGIEDDARFKIAGVRPSADQIYARKMGQNMIDTLSRLVAERQKNLGRESILNA